MSEQAKIERIIRLLLLLSGNCRFTINEISEKLETSVRTVYRYIETFRNAGLVIDKNIDGYWKLEKNNSQNNELHDLLQFSEEESYILQKAIHSIDDNNALKSNLVSKLYSLYDSDRVIDTIIKKENSETISKLSKAIIEKKQVRITDYKSANSNTVSDRILEPIKFSTNFISVWCYEPKNCATKLFKTARINTVEILDKHWENENQHKPGFIDCFRISSENKITVKLELSLRAKNLLVEEYPLAEKDLKELENNQFILETYVCNFTGIGRFILGLMDEITIISPPELKEYLNIRIKNKTF